MCACEYWYGCPQCVRVSAAACACVRVHTCVLIVCVCVYVRVFVCVCAHLFIHAFCFSCSRSGLSSATMGLKPSDLKSKNLGERHHELIGRH